MRHALRWDGSRDEHGDYRGRALAAGIAANGGRRNALVDQVVAWQVQNLGRSAFRTKVGTRVGKGCYALKNARYQATWGARSTNRGLVVDIVEREREAGRKVPSVPTIHRELSAEGWKVGPTGIRTALRSIPGCEAPRIAKARAGLSATARDLLRVFEEEVPKGTLVYVKASDCLRKMYVPSSNPSTQRSQKARLAKVIRELETTKNLGMTIRGADSWVWIGRGRAIPESLYLYGKENLLRCIALSPGIALGRAGLWSTEEGLMAKSLVDAALDEPYVDDNLAHLLGQESERMLDRREKRADQTRYTGMHGFTTPDRQMLAEANSELAEVEIGRGLNRSAVSKIRSIVQQTGFAGLWREAVTWPGLAAKTSTRSAYRMETLGRRLAEIDGAADRQHAFKSLLWRDTPKGLRSPEPPPPPRASQPAAAPVYVPPTPQELERRRALRARVEAMKAEQAAEHDRFNERRNRLIAAGIIKAIETGEKVPLMGSPGWYLARESAI